MVQSVQTLCHDRSSSHLDRDAYDQDDQSIDHRFPPERRCRQYRAHLEVPVYMPVSLTPLELQNDVYELYRSCNRDIDYPPEK